jgi:hypothetical protein
VSAEVPTVRSFKIGVADPPPAPAGRFRCRHDLLDGECAWCKGVRDTRVIGATSDRELVEDEKPTRLWFPAEYRGTCAGCSEPIGLGRMIAWSAEVGGQVGKCCEDLT